MQTRSGALHQYYINDGTVENSTGKNSLAKCGEVRAENQYVLAPGSYITPDAGDKGDGLYRIIDPSPLAVLTKSDLPEDFVPIRTVLTNETIKPPNTDYIERNHIGWTLRDLMDHDQILNRVLRNLNPGDRSAEDMSALSRLLYWEFDDNEAVLILRKYRWRTKLDRPDYIPGMLSKIDRSKSISRHVDIKRWHPARNNWPVIITENKDKTANTKTDGKKKPKQLSNTELYNLVLNSNTQLFKNQYGTRYARIPATPHQGYKNIQLNDQEFEEYIAHLAYKETETIPYSETIKQAINLLSYDAGNSRTYHLHNRVAPDPNDNGIWLDIANNNNEAIHITKDGWTITTEVPILFQRQQHQKPLPTPVAGGDHKKLYPFINVGASRDPKISEHQRMLLVIQTVCCLIPDIPHPINVMHGCSGSHKSTTQSFIRALIDPSIVEKQGIPENRQALIQILDHHYMPTFDNLSRIPKWFSDDLCCAVTGTGLEARKLYTDDKPFIKQFKRCIQLNGINLPINQQDILSRTILHPTEPTVKRMTEEQLYKEFSLVAGEILGAFLDAAVTVLNLKDTVQIPKNDFRLSDFFKWGYLFAEALGYGGEEFKQAMDENQMGQHDADQENNTVADVFLKMVNEDLTFYGTEDKPCKIPSQDLYNSVNTKALTMGVNTKNISWVKSANALIRRLNDSKATIVYQGWNYERYRTPQERGLLLWRTNNNHN